jgi:Mrp family chromosome partitioning ATPase
MVTEPEITAVLDRVLVPGPMRSLLKMNLVRGTAIDGGKVSIDLASPTIAPEIQARLKENIEAAVKKLDGVSEVAVAFSGGAAKELNEVGRVIAIMSGKGGVGKSLVTGLAAVALRRQGYEVGILDADITGPSVPKMFGVTDRPAGSDTGIMPVPTHSGIEVMSINLLLPDEDEAVIWRGPLIGRTITQFWEDVLWGKLDYMLVDLPPGTADAPLTVLQSLPISGLIIVFTPQDLTNMVVRKAVKMAKKMEKTILGVVENMSYLALPETGKHLEVFGRSRGKEMAEAAGAPLLGSFPLDPSLAALCDAGDIEQYGGTVIDQFAASLAAVVRK